MTLIWQKKFCERKFRDVFSLPSQESVCPATKVANFLAFRFLVQGGNFLKTYSREQVTEDVPTS